MLRAFYNKERTVKDGLNYYWKVFDPRLSKMYLATHIDWEIPGQTEERCTIGLCAAFCMYFDGKVIEKENGKLLIVARTTEDDVPVPDGVRLKECNE